jgi:hypothetical protein
VKKEREDDEGKLRTSSTVFTASVALICQSVRAPAWRTARMLERTPLS